MPSSSICHTPKPQAILFIIFPKRTWDYSRNQCLYPVLLHVLKIECHRRCCYPSLILKHGLITYYHKRNAIFHTLPENPVPHLVSTQNWNERGHQPKAFPDTLLKSNSAEELAQNKCWRNNLACAVSEYDFRKGLEIENFWVNFNLGHHLRDTTKMHCQNVDRYGREKSGKSSCSMRSILEEYNEKKWKQNI